MIELMVALAIVAVLMAVGVVLYGRMLHAADDTKTQHELVTASKVQALHHLETGLFSSDHDALTDLEPNVRYSLDGDPTGTIVVRTEPAREHRDVCLFAISRSGVWHSMYHSSFAGDLYGNSAPVECVPVNVADWSRQAWGS